MASLASARFLSSFVKNPSKLKQREDTGNNQIEPSADENSPEFDTMDEEEFFRELATHNTIFRLAVEAYLAEGFGYFEHLHALDSSFADRMLRVIGEFDELDVSDDEIPVNNESHESAEATN